MWTFVGAGIKDMKESTKPMKDVLHSDAKWYKTKAAVFHPDENCLMTEDGREISYDFMLLAPGLQLRFDLVSDCSTNGS